jgi:signal transduction histidine kinase
VGRESGTPGTGLGLSIVKEIARKHDGLVEVSSTGTPGEGAAFTLWLRPAEEPDSGAPVADAAWR